jgi:23S rRNA (guanosine2251-2'-O)-methyltransferase
VSGQRRTAPTGRTGSRRGPAGAERVPAVVAGRRPSLEAVRAGLALEVLVVEEARSTTGLRELVEAAAAAAVPVRRVTRDALGSLVSETAHQGVVARVRMPPELSESDLASRRWAEDAVVVVLDGVTDPRNVGAVARTAEAAGAAALVVRRHRSGGRSISALKASAGALLHLPVASVPNITRALDRLKAEAFWVVGLDARGTRAVEQASPPDGRVALVLGSEGEGLSRLVRESCDELLRISMRGRVASLNVSVAAGVGLFAYAVRGKEAGGGDRSRSEVTASRGSRHSSPQTTLAKSRRRHA